MKDSNPLPDQKCGHKNCRKMYSDHIGHLHWCFGSGEELEGKGPLAHHQVFTPADSDTVASDGTGVEPKPYFMEDVKFWKGQWETMTGIAKELVGREGALLKENSDLKHELQGVVDALEEMGEIQMTPEGIERLKKLLNPKA